jgi:hypothetical protein
LCKVPTVSNIIPTQIDSDAASYSPLTIIGNNFGSTTISSRIYDIAMNGYFYFRRKSLVALSWFNGDVVTHAPTDIPSICGRDITVEIVNEYGFPSRLNQLGKFSFNPPKIAAISSNSATTEGGVPITLSGTSFGDANSASATTVTVNGVAGTITSKTHTSLVFNAPPGSGRNLPVVISYCGQTSNQYLFRYQAPVLSSLSPSSGLVAGQTLTITGSSFGTVASAISASIGTRPCLNVNLITPHRAITCTVPVGCCTNQVVVVSVSGQDSNSLYIDYDRPRITAVTPASGPTLGGTAVTLTGTGFSTHAADPGAQHALNFGTTTCLHDSSTCGAITWTDTRITFTTPPAEGTVNINLNVGDLLSNIVTFASDAPVILSHSPATLPTSGGAALTLTGTNFGLTGRVTVLGKTCTVTARTAHTQLVCTTPTVAGAAVPVVVTVSGLQSAAYTVSASTPVVTSITVLDSGTVITDPAVPVTSTTAGGSQIRIQGSNFGTSPVTYVGSHECFFVSRSHTSITCTVPEGGGSRHALRGPHLGRARRHRRRKQLRHQRHGHHRRRVLSPLLPDAQ